MAGRLRRWSDARRTRIVASHAAGLTLWRRPSLQSKFEPTMELADSRESFEAFWFSGVPVEDRKSELVTVIGHSDASAARFLTQWEDLRDLALKWHPDDEAP